MIFLYLVFGAIGLSGALVTIMAMLFGADHDVDVDHDVDFDHGADFDHGSEFGHEGAHLEGKFSLVVISSAVSAYGFTGLFFSALLGEIVSPFSVLPFLGNLTEDAAIAAGSMSGLLSVPVAAVAWYLMAKFYTILKRQESSEVEGMKDALLCNGKVAYIPLSPGARGKVTVILGTGKTITLNAVLADGVDLELGVGESITVEDVLGDYVVVSPAKGISTMLEGGS
jgi:hypothetical protein